MKNFMAIVLVLVMSAIIAFPFLKPGLYQMHDDQHVARLYLFDKSLKSGQFPVRWVDELGFGFGYPLFNFYPPFVYMFGEVFHLLGFGFIDSIKVVFLISIFGSGVAMYIFARELWGRLAGLTAALFYMVLPYRALDVYVRGALAESFAFVWLPLVLWSFYKLYETQKKFYMYLSAIFLALLMITHNLIFLPFTLILQFYLLFLFLKTTKKKLFAVSCLLSVVLALGLSAFFWIPAIFEKKYTLVDQLLLTNLADFRIHFVYLQQLWNWTWGFGGSAEGLMDGISFKIGKLHILVSLLSVIVAIILLAVTRVKSKLSVVSCQLSVVFFALFLFSAFMTTNYSKFIWEIIKPLAYLQFPWRFLMFTGLFSSILAGALIYFLKVAIFRLIVFVVLLILLLLPNLKLFKPQNYRLNWTDEKATSYDVIAWDVSKTSFEYAPRGLVLTMDDLGKPLITLTESELPRDNIEVTTQNATIYNQKYSPSKISLDIDASEQTEVRANVFSFTGWQVLIDGQKVQIDDNNSLKLITFAVPQGFHEITLQFKNTPIRTAANLISLISIVLLIPLMAKKWPIPVKS